MLKKLLFICTLLGLGFSAYCDNFHLWSSKAFQQKLVESGLPSTLQQQYSAEQFLALTPSKIRRETGQRLNLKSIIALKELQKMVKQEINPGERSPRTKDQMAALLLVIFLGFLGIHRFYLGYPLIGIIQLLTIGMCGIWYVIDFFRIAFGDLKPKNGYYDPEL